MGRAKATTPLRKHYHFFITVFCRYRVSICDNVMLPLINMPQDIWKEGLKIGKGSSGSGSPCTRAGVKILCWCSLLTPLYMASTFMTFFDADCIPMEPQTQDLFAWAFMVIRVVICCRNSRHTIYRWNVSEFQSEPATHAHWTLNLRDLSACLPVAIEQRSEYILVKRRTALICPNFTPLWVMMQSTKHTQNEALQESCNYLAMFRNLPGGLLPFTRVGRSVLVLMLEMPFDMPFCSWCVTVQTK